jgi:hypothetical protein
MDLIEAKERRFDAGVRHPWEMARVDVVHDLIRRHAPDVDHGHDALVMDIGCGDTFVVEQLAGRHPHADFFAIDTAFTSELIDHYREQLNNPRIQPLPSLEAVPPLARSVSLVLLMDVVEHIQDDRGFLSGLAGRPFVGPDTKFLITVPAYQGLFCSHDTFLGHHRRYSNRSLRAQLEASGFHVIEIGYFFFSLLPIRLVQVVKERLIGKAPGEGSTGLVEWTGGRAKARIMRSVLACDAGISMWLNRAGIKLAGLSNYAICVKARGSVTEESDLSGRAARRS